VGGVYGLILAGRWLSGGQPSRQQDRSRDRDRRHRHP
jgi:hypothetical protein